MLPTSKASGKRSSHSASGTLGLFESFAIRVSGVGFKTLNNTIVLFLRVHRFIVKDCCSVYPTPHPLSSSIGPPY